MASIFLSSCLPAALDLMFKVGMGILALGLEYLGLIWNLSSSFTSFVLGALRITFTFGCAILSAATCKSSFGMLVASNMSLKVHVVLLLKSSSTSIWYVLTTKIFFVFALNCTDTSALPLSIWKFNRL